MRHCVELLQHIMSEHINPTLWLVAMGTALVLLGCRPRHEERVILNQHFKPHNDTTRP
jgi:hypothetical protein